MEKKERSPDGIFAKSKVSLSSPFASRVPLACNFSARGRNGRRDVERRPAVNKHITSALKMIRPEGENCFANVLSWRNELGKASNVGGKGSLRLPRRRFFLGGPRSRPFSLPSCSHCSRKVYLNFPRKTFASRVKLRENGRAVLLLFPE